jgi:hypothetical protein
LLPSSAVVATGVVVVVAAAAAAAVVLVALLRVLNTLSCSSRICSGTSTFQCVY